MRASAIIDTVRILAETAPKSLLIIDLEKSNALAMYPQQHPDCRVKTITDDTQLSPLKNLGQYQTTVIVNSLQQLDAATGANLLAQLRDVYTRHLLVLLTLTDKNTTIWEANDLNALGLVLLKTYPDEQQLYEYSVLDYKTVPDWLNAKNWANPELWDKYRW